MSYDGIGPRELAVRVRAPRCVSLTRVTSTLDVVHELAADGAEQGTLVVADEQVAGRGREGRTWHSPAGCGIWLGYLCRPQRDVKTGVLALRVGLVVTDAVADLGVRARLKWPNDVLVGRRKLAGILCEARWRGNRIDWIAVGIGMNVHGPLPPEIAASAIPLDSSVPGVTRVEVLERLVPQLLALPDAPELTATEQRSYERYDWLLGKELVEPVRGRAQGVDERGALLVETGEGLERVTGGRVVAA
jgi:BirA family biotin operon repressor/biotin-[acetyl-CoA-carboxylase] ligase